MGNILHGGIFFYNMCLLQTFFEAFKGILVLLCVVDGLRRVAHLLRKDRLDYYLKQLTKGFYITFAIGLAIFILTFETLYIQNEETFFYFKTNSKVYENREVKQVAEYINSLMFALSLVISFEIYYSLKKQNILYAASNVLFLGLNIAKLYINELYIYYWIQFVEIGGLYFLLWAQSSITKKEQFLLMIYD